MENFADLTSENWTGFSSNDPSYKSAATPPNCSEECMHCSEQFLPKVGKRMEFLKPIELHSDEQAEAEIRDLLLAINTNLIRIQAAIDAHGDAIASRWKKRKPNKREVLLRQAKHNLYARMASNEDDMLELDEAKEKFLKLILEEDNWKERESWISSAEAMLLRDHESALTPYLNVLTLRNDPLKLLALLHYRSQATPSEWILFDCGQIKAGFEAGNFRTAYNPHCMIALGPEFGKLVQWEEESAHKWDMIGYALARLALKAQHNLTDFLCKMVNLLLETDLSQAPKGRVAWDELAKQGFQAPSSDGTIWSYCDSVFGPAPKFDAQRIVELFTARSNAVKDDFWLMQTDPIHLRHLIDRFYGPRLARGKSPGEKEHILTKLMLGNVRRLVDWDTLLHVAQRVADQSIKFSQHAVTGDAIPEEYQDAIGTLERALKVVFTSRTDSLLLSCAALPSFRHHLAITEYGQPKVITPPEDSFRNDPLFAHIVELRLHNTYLSRYPSYHLAQIDEIISQSSKKERERIDQVVLDHLSDLATLEEGLTTIRYHRSRRPMNLSHLDKTLSSSIDGLKAFEYLENKVSFSSAGNEQAYSKLELLCRLPKPSGNTDLRDILRMCVLYKTLDEYWEEVRKAKAAIFEQQPGIASLSDIYLHIISASLDKDHRFEVRSEVVKLQNFVQMMTNEEDRSIDLELDMAKYDLPRLSSIHTDSESLAIPTAPKLKVKTRPHEDHSKNTNELCRAQILADSHVSDSTVVTSQVAVNRASAALFQRMFSSFVTGTTRWNELVAALVDAGFSATSNGGSAVTFKEESGSRGAIVFHRPHPDSRVDPEMLRGMGKRLTKWFGWDGDTFVVRSR